MPGRTPTRTPSTRTRPSTRAGRPATGGRFQRNATPSPSSGRINRTGQTAWRRPSPSRKPSNQTLFDRFGGGSKSKRSSGPAGLLKGLTGALGGGKAAKRGGGGAAKGAGGLAALAGLAGLALKNRDKLPGKLGGGDRTHTTTTPGLDTANATAPYSNTPGH
jgi:hypothetical protein